MDPLTHALSGMVIRQLGFRRNAALFVLVFSAVAPDLDYMTRFWGIDAFLRYHRGITHGVLALAAFPLLMGFLFRNRGGFFYYYALSFLAYASHIALDLTNQYGARVLSPLDWSVYSFDLTFIIDPYISIGLLGAVILGRLDKRRSAAVAVVAVLLVSGYLGGKSYLKEQTRHFLKTKIDANVYSLYPLPNGFLRWWFVAGSGEETVTGYADLFMKKVFVHRKYRPDGSDPAVLESKKDGTVRSFLYFARNPHAEVRREHDRSVVIWSELSYSFLPEGRFEARAVMDGRGKIVESGFRF